MNIEKNSINFFGRLSNTDNVFLFVPNIIAYLRIILAILSFWFMPSYHILAASLYFISRLLDALDGQAARWLNQSSRLGSMLDLLTDVCATTCLLTTLCTLYPSATFLFQMSMAIDISSHWLYMHTSVLEGKTSHKIVDSSGNWFLYKYYTDRNVLFWMCAGNELFYMSLYLLHYTPGPYNIFYILCYLTCPIAAIKTLIALIQEYNAALRIVVIDQRERATMKKD